MTSEMEIPIIKENRWSMIVEIVKVFDTFPFNRNKQRTSVLGLYANKKSEKSVFRGMVIPTLRHLGLILGRDEAIRLSANAKLISLAQAKSQVELEKVSRIVVYEIDHEKFGFLDAFERHKSPITEDQLARLVFDATSHLKKGRIRERIRRWTRVLVDVGLLTDHDGKFVTNDEALRSVPREIAAATDLHRFEETLLSCYRRLATESGGPVVDIASLRERVSTMIYSKEGTVLTEGQFDDLLRKLHSVNHDYVISMGRPSAWKEKSFMYRTNFYRTISIS